MTGGNIPKGLVMNKFKKETETLLELAQAVEQHNDDTRPIIRFINALAKVETFSVADCLNRGQLLAAADMLLYLANNWNGKEWLGVKPVYFRLYTDDPEFKKIVKERFDRTIKRVKETCLNLNAQ